MRMLGAVEDASTATAAQRPTMVVLIDRAARDPRFFNALATDCIAIAASLGRPIQLEEIKNLLGAPGVSDAELAELLVAGVARP